VLISGESTWAMCVLALMLTLGHVEGTHNAAPCLEFRAIAVISDWEKPARKVRAELRGST
jgi:hypothetical protein